MNIVFQYTNHYINTSMTFWLLLPLLAYSLMAQASRNRLWLYYYSGPSMNNVIHLLRGKGRSAKRWCDSISLFSKMGDKGEGGVKSLKKWVTSFMDGFIVKFSMRYINKDCRIFWTISIWGKSITKVPTLIITCRINHVPFQNKNLSIKV